MKKFVSSIATAVLMIFGTTISANALTAEYIDMGVPTNVNTSFKTWMDWRCITDKTSPQYKCIQQWGWRDKHGFMRANGERDLGIKEDYYMIALGSYYGTEIGTKYRITTDIGMVFYGILADQKADIHTNSTNQYAQNNDVVEFLVDTRYLRTDVKKMGSAGVFEPLRGHVAKIERIVFIEASEPEVNKDPLPSIKVNRGSILPTLHRKEKTFKWLNPPLSIITYKSQRNYIIQIRSSSELNLQNQYVKLLEY